MRLIWKQNSLECGIFVAKNHPISPSKKYLHILLVACTPLLAFIAYSGTTSAYWVLEPYDGWRILQIIVLLLLSLYGIFTQTNETSLPPNATRYLNLSVPLLIGLVIISVWTSEHSARAATDAALYALLATSIWAQAHIFQKHPSFAPNIAAWLAVSPVLTVIHLPISWFSYAFGSDNAG
jgi:hypothetical protein